MSNKFKYLNQKKFEFKNGVWNIDGNLPVDIFQTINFDRPEYIKYLEFLKYIKSAQEFWDVNVLRSWLDMTVDLVVTMIYNVEYKSFTGKDKEKDKVANKAVFDFERTMK